MRCGRLWWNFTRSECQLCALFGAFSWSAGRCTAAQPNLALAPARQFTRVNCASDNFDKRLASHYRYKAAAFYLLNSGQCGVHFDLPSFNFQLGPATFDHCFTFCGLDGSLYFGGTQAEFSCFAAVSAAYSRCRLPVKRGHYSNAFNGHGIPPQR